MFKYIDRGYRNTLVLIPGWATDHRIFEFLDLKYNYILPLNLSPFNFCGRLSEELKGAGIEKVSILGFSLGGFIAVEFARKYPEFIDELVLVSIREKYSKKDISQVRSLVSESKEAFLYKFYSQCIPDKEQFKFFKQNLLKYYFYKLTPHCLDEALTYLEAGSIKPAALEKVKRVRIMHGERDEIAPLAEALNIKGRLEAAEFILLKDTGHLPFLKKDFNEYFYGQKHNKK